MKILTYIFLHILYSNHVQASDSSTSLRGTASMNYYHSPSRRLSTTAWSSILAFICPPHLKHCPHHSTVESEGSTSGGSASGSASGSSSSSSTSSSSGSSSSSSTATSSSSSSTRSSSTSTSSATADDTSSSSTEEASATDDTTTSSSSTTKTDDTLSDTVVETSETLNTDDAVVEGNNDEIGGIMNATNFGWMYIAGAALLVGGLALAVVGKQRSTRSKEIGEGSKTGLIDITEDPVSVFVPMQNDSRIGNVLQGDIDDIIVEYGVKM